VPSGVDGSKVADVGSGAGFPGITIKLWAPEISLTLIESNQKKATFLKEITRALTLTNVNIQTARAESLAGVSFDVVTFRAVESSPRRTKRVTSGINYRIKAKDLAIRDQKYAKICL